MDGPSESVENDPQPAGVPRRTRGRWRPKRPSAKGVALWTVIVSLGILFVVLAVAIAFTAFRPPGYTPMQWLIALAFLAPLGAALGALIWYGRAMGRATAARDIAQESFRTVAATMGDGIITIDEGSRIQFVNAAVEEIFGYPQEELIGNELTMLMPERLRERHRRGLQRYLTTRKRNVSWEGLPFQGRRKDGIEIPLEISIGEHVAGKRHVFTGIVRDMTERMRAQQALAESEARFRGLVETAPEGIFVLDSEATILEMNPAGEQLLGRPRMEVLGHRLSEFVAADREPILRKYVEERLVGLGSADLYEGVWLGREGQRIHVQLTSQTLGNPEGDPYLVLFVRDVSEQRDMQRKLVESERWASMGRLASFVAHEINTPLTNISLLTASVSRRTTDADILERLKKISMQGKIAATITSELLKFGRPGAINPVETDLVGLVQGAVEQAEAFRKPGTVLHTELDNGPVLCHVDPIRIHEVVVNLLKNAYDATPNGSVTVRMRHRADSVAIAISDTGVGIPPEVQARLFEAFFTTKKKGEGTGLGLAISRNFVVSHGGDITVDSEVKKGSTFTVHLPQRPPGAGTET